MSIFSKPNKEKTGLEVARDSILAEMKGLKSDTAEYQKMIANVKTLTQLIELQKAETLSPNTIAIVIGNALIAIVVVGYESKNIVTTKVLPFLSKLAR